MLKELQSQGLNPAGGSPADFARFIHSETERWARVIHAMDAARANNRGARRLLKKRTPVLRAPGRKPRVERERNSLV